MFLLLLIGLGAAGVKAQVRIGGNTAPSAAAVLDLNASDAANTGKGGLVLPRVDLTSNTMQLTNGVANVTGTLVYDVTTTLGRIGVYYWNGNSWVLASLPSTSMADSGRFLISNGSTWVPETRWGNRGTVPYTTLISAPANVTWQLVHYGTWTSPQQLYPGDIITIALPSTLPQDLCYQDDALGVTYVSLTDYVQAIVTTAVPKAQLARLRCYRPSA